MRTVFSYAFDLHPAGGAPPAADFDRLTRVVARWVEADYTDAGWAVPADGDAHPAPGHTVSVARAVADDRHDLYALDWVAPDADDPTLVWGCRIELARSPLGLQAVVGSRVGTATPTLAPFRYTLHRPGVIDALLAEAPGSVGGEAIPTRPLELTDTRVPGFVDDTLFSPNRVLPVLVVTPDLTTGRWLADPAELQNDVLGLARVVALAQKSTTFKLTEKVGKEWSCFGGAVRLYWPGVTPEDDCRRHRIYFPDDIREGAERGEPIGHQIFRRLAGVAAFRLTDAPVARQVRAAAEKRRQHEFQRKLDDLTRGERAADEVFQAWDAAQATIARLEADVAAAEQLAEDATDRLRAVQEQFDVVGRAAALSSRTPAPAAPAAVALRRPADALTRAAAEFADVLEVLPAAAKAAAESPFQRPDEVYDVLAAVAAVARAWRAGRLKAGWFHALDALGFAYKDDISMTSAGKYGDEYTFVYGGQKRLFQNHVTLGTSHNPQKCLSVHWWRDEAAKRIVVGWCGKHLTNTKT